MLWCDAPVFEGKSPRSFGDEEGEVAKGDGDVVRPALEAALLVVIEAEFALEVLVDSFGAPVFLEELNQLDERHPLVGREMEVLRSRFTVAPLADEPDTVTSLRLATIVAVGGLEEARKSAPGGRSRTGART
ncbi:MAG TPA: hypothetical protein VN253_17235 [Kofleriaceae bacterium]|nr:hypothetical protein [Kofleriaceae bacterium]